MSGVGVGALGLGIRLAALVGAVVASSACGSSGDPGGPPTASAESTCAEGFAPNALGFCEETLAPEACPAGTRPKIGSATCEKVGWTSCTRGFEVHESGWGCIDTLPRQGCPGATREAYGDTRCVSVGNCLGQFPPPGAIVVDDSFTDGQLDGTHFRTIGEAVSAARDGATIAIAEGTYIESVAADKSLTIVGQCPSLVRIEEPGGEAGNAPGIFANKRGSKVVVKNLTVAGHFGGITVASGAIAEVEDVLVERARAFGILVDASSATVRRSKITGTTYDTDRGAWGIAVGNGDAMIDDTMIEGGTSALVTGTKTSAISALRVVATGQAPSPPRRASTFLSYGGQLSVERSVVHDVAVDAAANAEGKDSRVLVRESVLRGIKTSGSYARGYGAVAQRAGRVELASTMVLGAESVGLLVRDGDSLLRATDTVVIGPPSSAARVDANLSASSDRAGIGAQAIAKGKLVLDGVAVARPWGWGVYIEGGAILEAKRSVIDDVRSLEAPVEAPRRPELPFGFGLTVAAAEASLDDVAVTRSTLIGITTGRSAKITGSHVVVRGVVTDATRASGAGSAIAAGDGATIDLDASAIVDSTSTGVIATSGSESLLRLRRSTIHRTQAPSQGLGHGALVSRDATLICEDTAIFDNASMGLTALGGRAHVVRSVIARNPVGVHVQNGSFLVESSAESDLGGGEVRVSPDTRFLENATKLGVGEIPAPEDVLPR